MLLVWIYIFQVIRAQQTGQNITCGYTICYHGNGVCIGNPPSSCVCFDGYDTYPYNSEIMCSYTKKKQLIAFILELVITFGIGHLYTLNFTMGIPKMIFWIVGYVLLVSLRIVNKKRADNNPTTLMLGLAGCIICSGMVVWQIVDLLMFAFNKHLDGYGIELQSW